MQRFLYDYLDRRLSRRGFLRALTAAGLSAAAARAVVAAADVDEETAGTGGPAAGGGRVVTGRGGELLVEQLRAAGVRYVFTNPGSYEVGFFDALTDRADLQLILGLHEGVVVPIADGYQRVTGEPALVNVHAIAGTAQMAGQLYNAHRDGSALVVTAGMRDATRYSDDVLLAPTAGFSQRDVNRQFTKLSWEVRDPAAIALTTRRAFKTATTAPGGPVYVAYASSALEASDVTAEVWPRASFRIEARPRPAAEQVERLAGWIRAARRPLVIVGDEVWRAGAPADVVALAELAALPVAAGRLAFQSFPSTHPLRVERYTPGASYPAGGADLVVQLGARDPGDLEPPARPLVDPETRFVAVGLDAAMLGRTQPLDHAIVADVRTTCRDLVDALGGAAAAAQLGRVRDARQAEIAAATTAARTARAAEAAAHREARPIHPDHVGLELERVLDREAIVVSETFTRGHELLRFGHRPGEKTWIGNTGASLGWGIGAAIGAKLGAPDRQVVCSIGDGAVMYSAGGFWTMARYGVPVLVVVWNNRDYETVRTSFHRYGGRMAATGHYHGLYLGDPAIDFVQLAASQGVEGVRVSESGDVRGALKRGVHATRRGEPFVVEIVVARVGPGAESTWHQAFDLAATRTRPR